MTGFLLRRPHCPIQRRWVLLPAWTAMLAWLVLACLVSGAGADEIQLFRAKLLAFPGRWGSTVVGITNVAEGTEALRLLMDESITDLGKIADELELSIDEESSNGKKRPAK